MGVDLSLFQTPRKGDFGNPDKAAEHTRNLARAYNSYMISVNLRSIFAGVTPRATESMACGRLLFQYLCPPDRPMSRKMLTNCVKYEILSPSGLNGFREKYRYFINHPQDAMAMGGKARAEILHGHTLTHRVQTMIEKLSKVKKAATKPQKAKDASE
jgi:spore maturation protein CgeB